MCWIKLFERNLDFLVFSFAASLFLDLEIESVLNDISYRANEMERIFISEFNQVRDMKITSLKFDFFETIYSYNNIYDYIFYDKPSQIKCWSNHGRFLIRLEDANAD